MLVCLLGRLHIWAGRLQAPAILHRTPSPADKPAEGSTALVSALQAALRLLVGDHTFLLAVSGCVVEAGGVLRSSESHPHLSNRPDLSAGAVPWHWLAVG